MPRITLALALVALAACSATTTTSPNGTSTAIGLAPGSAGTASNEVWVCHGHKKPKWKHVAAPAVDAHHRHGDRISYEHQHAGWACAQ